VELAHMDAGAVARWFLDRWPDVRASDALEVVATEFSAQGLELRYYVALATTRSTQPKVAHPIHRVAHMGVTRPAHSLAAIDLCAGRPTMRYYVAAITC